MPNTLVNLSTVSNTSTHINQKDAVFIILFRAWLDIAKKRIRSDYNSSAQQLAPIYRLGYAFLLSEGQSIDIPTTDAPAYHIFLPEQALAFLHTFLEKLPTAMAATSTSQDSLPEYLQLATQFTQLRLLTDDDAMATQKIIIETLESNADINHETKVIWKQTEASLEALTQSETLASFIQDSTYEIASVRKALACSANHPILAR